MKILAEMPFDSDNQELTIIQGFNSPISHNDKHPAFDIRYALDFALPVGTEVRAVRDGIAKVIVSNGGCYRGLSLEQGRKIPKATSVTIQYPDLKGFPGTIFSTMQHLSNEGFSINTNSPTPVKKGQILAHTGLNGWVGPIPHLHLHFFYYKKGRIITVPFSLNGYEGPYEHRNLSMNLLKLAKLWYKLGK